MSDVDKNKVYEALEKLGIIYDVVEHEAVFTVDDMERINITSRGNVVKNLFVRNAKGNEHYLIVMHKDKKANLSDVQKQLGCTKLSFASDERLMKYLRLTKGSVTPLGVLNDESHSVVVVFDMDLVGMKRIGVHPNDNTATVFLDFVDLKNLLESQNTRIVVISILSIIADSSR